MSSSVPCAPSNRIDLPGAHRLASSSSETSRDPRPHAARRAAAAASSTGFQSIVRVLHQPVARVDVVADVLLERLRIVEIADADAAARDLVLVGRADAARGRADLALAAPRLRQQVELAVIRQDQVRLVADRAAGRRRRCRACVSSSISANSACGSTTTPLPMTQVTPGCRMPDGIRRRTNFVPFDVHGVAGVVSALIARDDREMRRQQIDDLALAFVAPLRAEHGDDS